MDGLKTQLEAAAKDRNSNTSGEKVPAVYLLPENLADATTDSPDPFRDAASYYRTS